MRLNVILFVVLVLMIALDLDLSRKVSEGRKRQSATLTTKTYTPSNAPVFVGQLRSNVIVSTNGGRTVFVTK